MSLGAYVGALLSALEPTVVFAVAMVPMASLSALVWAEPISRYRREEMDALGVTRERLRELWGLHEPLERPPRLDRERCFVVGALGDRICPPGHAQALWRHWRQPGLYWYAGGHLAQFGRGRALAAVRRFLDGLGLA
jgi:hypothetical protein